MDKYFKKAIDSTASFLRANIHTILLLTGIGMIDYAGYLFGIKSGFIITGLSLIGIALLLNYGGKEEQRG